MGVSPVQVGGKSRRARCRSGRGREDRERQRYAEKKKRRLEKALANATAMRCELEARKLQRKEEQRRLERDGEQLAEAVALRVLVDGNEGERVEGGGREGGKRRGRG